MSEGKPEITVYQKGTAEDDVDGVDGMFTSPKKIDKTAASGPAVDPELLKKAASEQVVVQVSPGSSGVQFNGSEPSFEDFIRALNG